MMVCLGLRMVDVMAKSSVCGGVGVEDLFGEGVAVDEWPGRRGRGRGCRG